jgi:hypothetical protein
MKHFYLLTALCLALTGYANAQTNLLTNPGAESNYDGWTATSNGDGWGIDGSSLNGSACWASSYNSSTMTQTIDLLAKGYTEADLDAAPVISAGIYVRTNSYSGGTISITVELLNSSGVVVYTQKIADNVLIDKNLDWSLKNSYITNYGSGVRKIRFTFSGSDNVGWSGHYGPCFDDAFVNIVNTDCVANTTPASNKQIHSATLGASIYNSDTDSKTIQFEYGTSKSLGTTVTADQSPVAVTGESQVSATDGTNTLAGNILRFTTLTPRLTISETKVKIESAANSTSTLSISSNTSWNISYDNTWLTIDKTSGTGDATLTLTANDNTTGVGRFIELSITSPDYTTQTVVVYQKGVNSQVSLAAMEMGSSRDATAPILDNNVQNIKTLQTSGYLRIKPLETAEYTFTSSSSSDPAIQIHQGSSTAPYLVTSDDEGGNSQFKVPVVLTAGELYYLEIFNYSIGGGDITLTISGGKLQGFDYTGTGNWSETANWNWGCLPSVYNNVTITGNVTADQDISIQDLTIAPTGVLTNNGKGFITSSITLQANATQTATLLTNVENLTATAQTYLSGNIWNLYSPTSSAGNINGFILNTDNAIPIKGNDYGMMSYNEAGNGWNSYYTSATTDVLSAGKGYSLRRSADGTVLSFGHLTTGNHSVTLSNAGEGWNCIGNPYPSALKMTDNADGSYNFLKTNASSLAPEYACLYIWDGASYKIKGNAPYGDREWSTSVFPSGQGFFVKAANEGATISFTPEMQIQHSILCKKAAKAVWPNIQLSVASGSATATAVVAFNQQMTNGLDVTYDAGLLRGTSGLNLYSRLVEDNGVDFALQCLPTSYDGLNIPLGVECKEDGNITFTAETAELPADASFELFDSEANIATPITDNFVYIVNVEANANLVNRFYLRSKSSSNTKSVNNVEYQTISAYANAKHIYINGASANSRAQLFDVNGRCVSNFKLNSATETISAEQFIDGVYILKINEKTFKVILK